MLLGFILGEYILKSDGNDRLTFFLVKWRLDSNFTFVCRCACDRNEKVFRLRDDALPRVLAFDVTRDHYS